MDIYEHLQYKHKSENVAGDMACVYKQIGTPIWKFFSLQ